MTSSTLELRPTDRRADTIPVFSTVGRQSPRRFLDFVVDGKSLYAAFKEMPGGNVYISCLGGWYSNREEERKAAERLLGRGTPDAPEGRCTIYICPECGDIDCGAIVVKVERSEGALRWSDFGLVWFDYEERDGFSERFPVTNPIADVGPFVFDVKEIDALLAAAISD